MSFGKAFLLRTSVGVAAAIAAVSVMGAQSSGIMTEGDIATMLMTYRRPATVPAPADNPITGPKTELGKALFFDPRLSGSGTIACSTCHNPSLGWQDGLALGVGHHGAVLERHTPTILNIAWSEPLFWDGRADTLEAQAKGPLSAPAEMNMPATKVVDTVRSISGYRAAFATAFPGEPISLDAIAKAIATYERTVISGAAPFDRWVGGDAAAVSASAKRGFILFSTSAGCSSCHSGWRFSDDGFHDIGLPGRDIGRARIVPGLTILDHAFKTPTLRNIAERGPYMHDGSLPTLEAVIDHYDHGYIDRSSTSPDMQRLKLTAGDKADLVEFMRSLSSRDASVTMPLLYR